ncbi:hypothetical protein U5A82_06210 [Sphingobium sp. CR2-8]|uniref:hypothetical protein n=1 Tax=Sphingobium sp. CR2-8 TaxID=1306534 RepID=UPI002DB69D7F|nr:hypothetical protein [Sphingobium sp. CR2-8]MEC3910082.1 hypothetical protein [Sphingobium sp. CR2-8]
MSAVTLEMLLDRFYGEIDRLCQLQDQPATRAAILQLTPAMALLYLPEGNSAWNAAKVYELFAAGDPKGAVLFKLQHGGAL